MGLRLKSRQTRIISTTDHLRDTSLVVVSFLVAEQRDKEVSILRHA